MSSLLLFILVKAFQLALEGLATLSRGGMVGPTTE
jgi:hypothetical protein